MKRLFLACCGLALVPAAIAQARLPPDVARYVEKRDGCDHFRGEDPYDEERRRFLLKRTTELCVGTDKRLAALKKKYRNDAAVMKKLDEYEPEIEMPQSGQRR